MTAVADSPDGQRICTGSTDGTAKIWGVANGRELLLLKGHSGWVNAILQNPFHGVQRPRSGANEGKTPVLSDVQARQLVQAPHADTLKGKRDCAILAVLLYHALRRAELCSLRVKDYAERRRIKDLRVHGKGGKIRYVPVHPAAARQLEEYLDAAGYRAEPNGSLFRCLRRR